LHVEDHVSGLLACLERGRAGESYNFGGNAERRNIDVVTAICSLLDERLPRQSGSSYSELINYVTDRPGHDFRYAVCSDKAECDLDWCEDIQANRYAGRRLGTVGVTKLAS
jgi:dTDP-glucose 4,6-dehydratase